MVYYGFVCREEVTDSHRETRKYQTVTRRAEEDDLDINDQTRRTDEIIDERQESGLSERARIDLVWVEHVRLESVRRDGWWREVECVVLLVPYGSLDSVNESSVAGVS